jgi:hypothetical protein
MTFKSVPLFKVVLLLYVSLLFDSKWPCTLEPWWKIPSLCSMIARRIACRYHFFFPQWISQLIFRLLSIVRELFILGQGNLLDHTYM